MRPRESDSDDFRLRGLSAEAGSHRRPVNFNGRTAVTEWVLVGSLVALCGLTLWGTVGIGSVQPRLKHPVLPIGMVSRH